MLAKPKMERKKKLRIAMLIEAWKPIWAGGQVHVWELCKRLVNDYNCEVDLFVMDLKDNCPDKKKNDCNYPKQESHFNNKLNIFRIGKQCQPYFSHRLKWCWRVIKLIKNKHKKKKYDLIHAHANLPGLPGKILSKKLNIPLVYTVHGCGLKAITDMYGKSLKSKILYFTENILQTKIRYNSEITVDSSFLKYKNINNNIQVIPNGVDIEKYDEVKAKKSDKFKIIFVGRIHPQKGLTYLLDALNIIKNGNPLNLKNVEVHIIGSGELERRLKQKSQVLGLNEIIKFRGKIYGEELIREYKSAHLFVLPSLYEGQPLTLLEAWAAKLPVIVTDVGGNKDFIITDENGYIIPAKNVKELAQTLLKVINNKNLKNMGEKGYKLVKENYTWDKMVEKVFDVYIKTMVS